VGGRVFSSVPEQADLLLIGGENAAGAKGDLRTVARAEMGCCLWGLCLSGSWIIGPVPAEVGGYYDTYARVQDIGCFVPIDACVYPVVRRRSKTSSILLLVSSAILPPVVELSSAPLFATPSKLSLLSL